MIISVIGLWVVVWGPGPDLEGQFWGFNSGPTVQAIGIDPKKGAKAGNISFLGLLVQKRGNFTP